MKAIFMPVSKKEDMLRNIKELPDMSRQGKNMTVKKSDSSRRRLTRFFAP
jgi:hypothetical protein